MESKHQKTKKSWRDDLAPHDQLTRQIEGNIAALREDLAREEQNVLRHKEQQAESAVADLLAGRPVPDVDMARVEARVNDALERLSFEELKLVRLREIRPRLEAEAKARFLGVAMKRYAQSIAKMAPHLRALSEATHAAMATRDEIHSELDPTDPADHLAFRANGCQFSDLGLPCSIERIINWRCEPGGKTFAERWIEELESSSLNRATVGVAK
jgi:hypothetical protein